jgi:hypothetical protein
LAKKKKQQEEEVDYSTLVTPTTNNKSILIHFDEIFNNEELSTVSEFVLKKRSYYALCDIIMDALVNVFNNVGESALMAYMAISYKIKDNCSKYNSYSVDEFLQEVIVNRYENCTVQEFLGIVEEDYNQFSGLGSMFKLILDEDYCKGEISDFVEGIQEKYDCESIESFFNSIIEEAKETMTNEKTDIIQNYDGPNESGELEVELHKALHKYRVFISFINDVIDEYTGYSLNEFEEDLLENEVLTEEVQQCIIDAMEARYTPTMDEATEKTRRTRHINEELQFTDEHVRILLYSTETMRYAIPLITDFCENRKRYNLVDTLYEVFSKIIELYEGEIDIMNKLHRFTYARVVQSKYSDRVMWIMLNSKSENIDIFTLNVLVEIVTGILPKAVPEQNIVNLLHVVIRKKRNFAFSKNHKITFKPVNFNYTDSEGLTTFDKWEINMNKKNEAKSTINELSINQVLSRVSTIFGYKVTKEEYEYYSKFFQLEQMNSLQQHIMFLFYAKYTGSYQNNFNCSRQQYIMMMIIIHKWLSDKGFDKLAEFIIAVPDKLNEKRSVNKNKIYDAILNCKAFTNLLRHKYNHIEFNIGKNPNIIFRFIGNVSASKFVLTVPYEDVDDEYKEGIMNGELEFEQEEFTFKTEKLATEYIEFLNLAID